jgi:cyanophycinase
MSPLDRLAKRPGSLMIIGGAEDRTDDKEVLRTFIELAGGRDAPLAIVTAASEIPDKVWGMYREALSDLGATALSHVRIESRQAADNEALAQQLLAAGGIFLTGGDQQRLLERIGGTRAGAAIRAAYAGQGACVAGTSAGASGLCTHMIAEGQADGAPEVDGARLADGLGLVSRVVVDQHFSQRHRINRLLGIVAQHPFLLGAGIDEDTALVVHGDRSIEVLGNGSVTIVDCRCVQSNIAALSAGEVPRLLNVCLHLLPSGSRFTADMQGPLADFIHFLLDSTVEP